MTYPLNTADSLGQLRSHICQNNNVCMPYSIVEMLTVAEQNLVSVQLSLFCILKQLKKKPQTLLLHTVALRGPNFVKLFRDLILQGFKNVQFIIKLLSWTEWIISCGLNSTTKGKFLRRRLSEMMGCSGVKLKRNNFDLHHFCFPSEPFTESASSFTCTCYFISTCYFMSINFSKTLAFN